MIEKTSPLLESTPPSAKIVDVLVPKTAVFFDPTTGLSSQVHATHRPTRFSQILRDHVNPNTPRLFAQFSPADFLQVLTDPRNDSLRIRYLEALEAFTASGGESRIRATDELYEIFLHTMRVGGCDQDGKVFLSYPGSAYDLTETQQNAYKIAPDNNRSMKRRLALLAMSGVAGIASIMGLAGCIPTPILANPLPSPTPTLLPDPNQNLSADAAVILNPNISMLPTTPFSRTLTPENFLYVVDGVGSNGIISNAIDLYGLGKKADFLNKTATNYAAAFMIGTSYLTLSGEGGLDGINQPFAFNPDLTDKVAGFKITIPASAYSEQTALGDGGFPIRTQVELDSTHILTSTIPPKSPIYVHAKVLGENQINDMFLISHYDKTTKAMKMTLISSSEIARLFNISGKGKFGYDEQENVFYLNEESASGKIYRFAITIPTLDDPGALKQIVADLESLDQTKQLSPQELTVQKLNQTPLPGLTWAAEGTTIKLNKGKNTVAVLNKDGGGVVFSDAKAINDMLFQADGKGGYVAKDGQLVANENGRAALVSYLKNYPDSHFFSYSIGDKQPPVAVTLSPDGKSIALVQGFAGTTGYEWHKEAKALAATSEGNQVMYFLDSAGKWQQCIVVKDGAKENAIFGADWGRWIWDKEVVYPDNWQYAQDANKILSAMKAHPDFYPAAVRDNLPWLFNMKNKDISNTAYFAWIENHITDKSFAEKLRAVNDPVFRLMAVNTNEKITVSNRNQFNIVTGIEITDDVYQGPIARLAHEMTHARQPKNPSSINREVIAWFNSWFSVKLTWNPPNGVLAYIADSMKQLRLLPPYLNINDYLK